MEYISKINNYFRKCFEKASSFKLAEKTSDIPSDVADFIKRQIPQNLFAYINSDNYIIKGSVGAGKATKTPWIAILDKNITRTTREGVYIVFLFSSDYKSVYLTFNQGTTIPGQFGPRLDLAQIIKKRNEIRHLLKIDNSILNIDDSLDVSDKRYKQGAIYYTLWGGDDKYCKELLDLYINVYKKYKSINMGHDEIKTDIVCNIAAATPLQTIYYGTPGSGKSHKVKKLIEGVNEDFVFRTTFHPDSDYASFVGCYKPKTSCVKSHQLKKTLDELKDEAKDITSQPTGNKVSQIIEFVTKYATLLPIIVEEYDEVQSMQNLLNKHLGFANETYLTYIVDYVNANQKQESKISYEFCPQAFTKAYVKAWQNPGEPVYLIIEEINRGNCAQIFGDLFQLLDRKDGVSEYPIDADNDLKDYLEKELGIGHAGIANGKLRLPSNLNILATMNTSDQSLFPMDSAFKRRWSWQCVPIEYEEKKRDGYKNDSYDFTINIDNNSYSWIDFLKKTNDRIYKATDSEDKQMGNFFITHDVDEDEFVDKVMFYLWNDVCKEEVRTKNNFFRNYIDDKKQEEKEFSFNDLFKNNRIELLLKFMEYIGVEPKETKQQTAESESEE